MTSSFAVDASTALREEKPYRKLSHGEPRFDFFGETHGRRGSMALPHVAQSCQRSSDVDVFESFHSYRP